WRRIQHRPVIEDEASVGGPRPGPPADGRAGDARTAGDHDLHGTRYAAANTCITASNVVQDFVVAEWIER
ncbi:MAG: hypothetical protein ACREDC_00170, partial [Bradyrhizobium sp.]